MIRSPGPESLNLTTQADPLTLGVSQYLLLSIAVIAIFGIEVVATGYVAKQSDIFDANYGKALWAATKWSSSPLWPRLP
jgi:hypothetical protein